MISYQNFLLNTLMDIKLLAGFRSTIPMLGKKKKKKQKNLHHLALNSVFHGVMWHSICRTHLQFSSLIHAYI